MGASTGAAMVRRGFTLIEMLAVIAILVVVAAIGLPVARERLADARFDAAVRRVDAGMAWARAEAQRRGEALRVEARASDGGTGLFVRPLESVEEDKAVGGSPRTDAAKGRVLPAPQPFAVVEQGLVVTAGYPGARRVGGGGGGPSRQAKPDASQAAPASAADGVGAPLQIATFLPDGSAMAAAAFYISGGSRAASLTVNHWTGGVQVKLIDLTAMQAGVSSDGDASPGGVAPAEGGKP